MPLSNSVTSRYTPPTCTLEIVPPTSPLSRGVGRPVNTPLSFQLRFDDPQLPEEERVTIAGDRNQLEALHQAVTTYVQHLLNQSLDRFKATVGVLAPPLPDAAATTAPFGEIFLQPGGGLAHNLFLGPLATKESGPVIHLSVLQLFDLATALDEYAADMVALPALPNNLDRSKPASTPPAWASIAAILLLAVGLTTAVVQFLNWQNPQEQTATTTPPQGSSKNLPQTALQPSPLPKVSTSIPPQTDLQPSPLPKVSTSIPPQIALQPSPLPKVSTSIPPLSDSEKLPLLPPLSSTVPSPGSSLPSVTVPQTTTALKGTRHGTVPRTATALPNQPQLILPPTPPVNSISPITPPPPIPRHGTIPSTLPLLTPANPDLESAPSVATRGAFPGAESSNTPTAASSPNSATLPYPPGTSRRNGNSSGKQQAFAGTGNGNPFKEGVDVPGATTPPRSTPTTPNQSKSPVFDIPQVAEARDYFKQHWEPPSSLTQNLEYNLVLDIDGTIQRIEPIGQAARNYVDRSGMPLIGERFVSPIASGQTAIIRVVLSPNGKVQTFLESSN